MNKLVFGKYIPLDTFLHKTDPRAKIIAMFILLVGIFLPSGWWGYLLMIVVMAILVYLSKLGFKFILKSLKPMFLMLAFLLIINILVVRDGGVLLDLKYFQIYTNAILNTAYIAVRLILMIMVTTLLTATTKPLDLTVAIEYLLKPLGVFKVPYHDIAMMISISLRFIPTIIEETYLIMNAQKSRGVDFEQGKLREKVVAILSLIVPLFSVAILMAGDLANAMEARCYVPGAKRTRYKVLQYHTRDHLLIIGSFLLVIALGVIAYVL